MSVAGNIAGRLLVAIAAWTPQSAWLIDEASGASYFCSPAPIKLGSYRPDDSDEELDISVRAPDASPFWFDDQTGDYIALQNGKIGPLESRKVRLPLEMRQGGESVGNTAAFAFLAGQCAAAEMGVVPETMTKP